MEKIAKKMAKRSYNSHGNCVHLVLRFLVRLRTYSVSFVSYVVETSRARSPSAVTDVHVEAQSILRCHRGFYYSITHSIQPRGTEKMVFPGLDIGLI